MLILKSIATAHKCLADHGLTNDHGPWQWPGTWPQHPLAVFPPALFIRERPGHGIGIRMKSDPAGRSDNAGPVVRWMTAELLDEMATHWREHNTTAQHSTRPACPPAAHRRARDLTPARPMR